MGLHVLHRTDRSPQTQQCEVLLQTLIANKPRIINYNLSFGLFLSFPGQTWPRDPLQRVRPEKWYWSHLKLTSETHYKAISWQFPGLGQRALKLKMAEWLQVKKGGLPDGPLAAMPCESAALNRWIGDNLGQRDPEVFVWPSGFSEAWGAQAKKRHLFKKILICWPCRLRRQGQRKT